MVRFGFAIVVTAAAGLMTPAAFARDYNVGSLTIVQPWARATPKGAGVGGGYFVIINNGSTPDRFLGGSSDVAERLEVHQMRMENGIMTMRARSEGLEIKPGERLEFKPAGYHLMFAGLRRPLMQGEPVTATLSFEKAGAVKVEFTVGPMGAPGPERNAHKAMPGMAGHQH